MHLRVGRQRRDVADPALGDTLAQQAEHRLGNVGPGDVPGRADRLRERK